MEGAQGLHSKPHLCPNPTPTSRGSFAHIMLILILHFAGCQGKPPHTRFLTDQRLPPRLVSSPAARSRNVAPQLPGPPTLHRDHLDRPRRGSGGISDKGRGGGQGRQREIDDSRGEAEGRGSPNEGDDDRGSEEVGEDVGRGSGSRGRARCARGRCGRCGGCGCERGMRGCAALGMISGRRGAIGPSDRGGGGWQEWIRRFTEPGRAQVQAQVG
jgi:hypothetical protein